MQSLAPEAQKVRELRNDFPILREQVRGKPLVYLDNAATTQKPQAVLNAMERFYTHDNANVHRGVHLLSQRATDDFDQARVKLQRFVNAGESAEIIFTKGCTEATNLVAASWGRANLQAGDEILLSTMEHHANIVPWQIVAAEKGAHIRPIPINDAGEIDLEAYRAMLSPRVKMVGVVHVSNSLGTINAVAEMIALAHGVGAKVLVDGAQALAHLTVDVQALDADFYAMSSHKMYGPTGVGALYGKRDLLEAMPPYQAGGDMIRTVSFDKTTYNDLPNKFEPGTPNIAGVIGFGAAVDYLMGLDRKAIAEHEDRLTELANEALTAIPGVRLVGTAPQKASVVSFTLEGAHPHDIGTILDMEGIAVRTGHHCCMPLMTRLGLPATVRASFALYNTEEDVARLASGLHKVKEVLG
ncbi:MAG: cysteine desulfurase [Fimbriimonadaceae bacterium]|nr:cysteine desulfurase [Fimbriimonadaceae bacterium]